MILHAPADIARSVVVYQISHRIRALDFGAPRHLRIFLVVSQVKTVKAGVVLPIPVDASLFDRCASGTRV
jgi:hypothetical protein